MFLKASKLQNYVENFHKDISLRLILLKRVSLELIEEILLSSILLNGLDVLAEPDTINKLIINIIKNHNQASKKEIEDRNGNDVQLLKHWCQMNGYIFKSIQAPGFKDTVENNEILHFFIGYLNSINSISVLQLFFTISKIFFN